MGEVLWLKSCSRCGGDLLPERDLYGPYVSCVQCGYYVPEAEEAVLRQAHSRSPAAWPANAAPREPLRAAG